VCSPPPSPYPRQPSDPHHPPSSPFYLEGAVRAEVKMGNNSSTSGRRRQQHSLTMTLSAAGRAPLPLHPVTSHLMDLYHECIDNGGWARVLYDVHGGMEKLTIIRKILPAPTVAAPPLPGRTGGVHKTEGAGRLGLRGGSTTPGLAPTHHPQRKKFVSQLSLLLPLPCPLPQIIWPRQYSLSCCWWPYCHSLPRHLR
jgi:hypothetical protein